MHPPISEAAEPISDEDQVSRAYFEIPGEIDPESHFPFGYDNKADERGESVYWRKYVPLIAGVHERGCRLELVKNDRRKDLGKATIKYTGARTAIVGAIRSIRTQRGHKFAVIHFPEEGDNAHAHILIEPAMGTRVGKLKSNDVRELVSLLVQQFGALDRHDCSTLGASVGVGSADQ